MISLSDRFFSKYRVDFINLSNEQRTGKVAQQRTAKFIANRQNQTSLTQR
jgi:hypothetical protein